MLRVLLLIEFLVPILASNEYINYPEVQQTYKFYRAPQTWFDARETCRRDDAALAMPKNEAETLVLKKIFDGYPALILKGHTFPDYILLGFHDIFKEGEYITNEGIPIQYYFHTWDKGQPDNKYDGKSEDCGSMHRTGFLNDLSCHIPTVFICQKNKREEKNLTNFECISPDPAYMYSNETNKCYKLHLNPKIWSEARTICQSEGGNLAIINNKAEEDFLVKMFTNPRDRVNHVLLKDYALLGFHDIFHEGYFMTVEDNELQNTGYTNWAVNQPDDAGGNEDCGSMWISGGLNDFPCNVPAVFFCEIDSNTIKNSDPVHSVTESSTPQYFLKKDLGQLILFYSPNGKNQSLNF